MSHNNVDDGWDLYTKSETGPIGAVTTEDSLAYENGTLSDGSQHSNGDRNGYKLGGDDIEVDHVVRRSIAYNNRKHGFTYNSNPGQMSVSGNVGIDNSERNFQFDGGTSVFRDNVSCRGGSGTNDRTIGDADGSNQFWTGTNGSRCSGYTGALDWSFATDGSLAVTFGGNPGRRTESRPGRRPRPGSWAAGLGRRCGGGHRMTCPRVRGGVGLRRRAEPVRRALRNRSARQWR